MALDPQAPSASVIAQLRAAYGRGADFLWNPPLPTTATVTPIASLPIDVLREATLTDIRAQFVGLLDSTPERENAHRVEVQITDVRNRADSLHDRQCGLHAELNALQVTSDALVSRSVNTLQRIAAVESSMRHENQALVDLRAKVSVLTRKSNEDAETIAELTEANATASFEVEVHRRRAAELQCSLAAATQRAVDAEEACTTLSASFMQMQSALEAARAAEALRPATPPGAVPASQVQAIDRLAPCTCRYLRHFVIGDVPEIDSVAFPDTADSSAASCEALIALGALLQPEPHHGEAPCVEPSLGLKWRAVLDDIEASVMQAPGSRVDSITKSHSRPKRLCAACTRGIGSKAAASCGRCSADMHASCAVVTQGGAFACPRCAT
jgi:hypothetical protein